MSELIDYRKAKDRFFAQDHQSPFSPEQRRHFHGLEYFPENAGLRFILKIEELPRAEQEAIDIITSTGDSRQHIRWGTLTFTVDQEPATLTVYKGRGKSSSYPSLTAPAERSRMVPGATWI